MAGDLTEKIARWQAELDRIKITFRWGETRRFHSNTRKIERQRWLLDHIMAARLELEKAAEKKV